MNEFLRQQQFLEVIDRDEAERRFRAAIGDLMLDSECIQLNDALGRVLAEEIIAPIDVPGFDRSNIDGFAVRAEDTFGAAEDRPLQLRVNSETLSPGQVPTQTLSQGTATPIATGGMLPRGANAAVMIEHTEYRDGKLIVARGLAPGGNVSFTGSDIAAGELILNAGELLSSRETGVLAALGFSHVKVTCKPRVAIISTGDELKAPGETLQPGEIFDSNATVLADAVREIGGSPVPLGIVPDDFAKLVAVFRKALDCDVVLLSGGTSKGAGDISYRVVAECGPPGIIVHGVALKPGKPLCLGAVRVGSEPSRIVPVAVLPGFPTSAVFTFHEFLAPVIRQMAGQREKVRKRVQARLPVRVNSERGRTEYLLVGLIHDSIKAEAFLAFPMGKGSGSVTAFSKADGFIAIPRQREFLEAGEEVEVQLLGDAVEPADLVVIGSHCIGQDYLLKRLREVGIRSKFLAVGSMGGLEAVRRGECDLAGIHLFHPESGEYNQPFVPVGVRLIPGYRRSQGIVFRKGDARFAIERESGRLLRILVHDVDCLLANRNRGSGTRILLDSLLMGLKPSGYHAELKSHQAVAAAVAQGRADWGLAIRPSADHYDLDFLPVRDEIFDFISPEVRWKRPEVQRFVEILNDPQTKQWLLGHGFAPGGEDAK